MQEFNDLSGLDALEEMFYGPGGKKRTTPTPTPEFNNPMEATRQQVEDMIIAWRAKRAERLELDKVANKAKQEEENYKSFILECFKQQKFEGMLIDGRTTGLTTKKVPTVSDKEELLAYIRESGELDLLQFRLSAEAVNLRKENEIDVPGTEYVEVYDLFDRKV